MYSVLFATCSHYLSLTGDDFHEKNIKNTATTNSSLDYIFSIT